MEPRARGRILQGTTFEVTELVGSCIEQLVGFAGDPGRSDRPDVIALKVPNKHWYRFFWDAGLCFCEELLESDPGGDFDDGCQFDYTKQFGVAGQMVDSASCAKRSKLADELWIELRSGAKLVFRPVIANAPDSDAELHYEMHPVR